MAGNMHRRGTSAVDKRRSRKLPTVTRNDNKQEIDQRTRNNRRISIIQIVSRMSIIQGMTQSNSDL
jgi:hypothetical protein